MVVTHDQVDARVRVVENALAAGVARFNNLDCKIDAIATSLENLPQMQEDISATKDLVAAWATVKNTGRFVKWIGGIAAAIVAITMFVRATVKALVP